MRLLQYSNPVSSVIPLVLREVSPSKSEVKMSPSGLSIASLMAASRLASGKVTCVSSGDCANPVVTRVTESVMANRSEKDSVLNILTLIAEPPRLGMRRWWG